jgi:hypothetical protein
MTCELYVEKNGFSSEDIDENGDFSDFGAEDFRADVGDLDIASSLGDYQWAYTIRQIELTMPDDLTGTATDLIGEGYLGDNVEMPDETSDQSLDLGDLGLSSDTVTDELSSYIREVRVWCGGHEQDEKLSIDSVELTT